MKPTRLKKILLDPLTGLAVLVASVSVFKIALFYDTNAMFETKGGFALPILLNEFKLYSYLILLLVAGNLAKWRYAQLGSKIALVSVIGLCLIDLWVLMSFFHRVSLSKVYTYLIEMDLEYCISVIREFFYYFDLWSYAFLLTIILACAVSYRFVKDHRQFGAKKNAALATVAALFFIPELLCGFDSKMAYYWVARNTVDAIVIGSKTEKKYSEEFSKNFLASYPGPEKKCVQGLGIQPKPNVIVVVVESFSLYHSKYLSGICDYTPRLDSIMKENMVLANFFANGVTSEHGLIPMFLGKVPLTSPEFSKYSPFRIFNDPADSLPTFLNYLGYETAFLTASNFDSFGIGSWAKTIGFQTVRTREQMIELDSSYSSWTTVPDKSLYMDALEQMRKMKKPFFLVLETGTTHEPFVEPESGKASEELCFKYADRQLSDFIRLLESEGFFENSLMIVTADHRIRKGLLKEEYRKYGENARFRIPLVVIDGAKQPRTVEEIHHQTDLAPSLKYLLSKAELCLEPTQGIFLPEHKLSPVYVISRSVLDYREDMTVIFRNQSYEILLDGDRTRFKNPGAQLTNVIDYINYQRLTNKLSPRSLLWD